MKRVQKRKYSPGQIAKRLAMAQKFGNMTEAQLESEVDCSMDGVVIIPTPCRLAA